jgi:hypothetical protein
MRSLQAVQRFASAEFSVPHAGQRMIFKKESVVSSQ